MSSYLIIAAWAAVLVTLVIAVRAHTRTRLSALKPKHWPTNTIFLAFLGLAIAFTSAHFIGKGARNERAVAVSHVRPHSTAPAVTDSKYRTPAIKPRLAHTHTAIPAHVSGTAEARTKARAHSKPAVTNKQVAKGHKIHKKPVQSKKKPKPNITGTQPSVVQQPVQKPVYVAPKPVYVPPAHIVPLQPSYVAPKKPAQAAKPAVHKTVLKLQPDAVPAAKVPVHKLQPDAAPAAKTVKQGQKTTVSKANKPSTRRLLPPPLLVAPPVTTTTQGG